MNEFMNSRNFALQGKRLRFLVKKSPMYGERPMTAAEDC
jgi:hypothetical protein